jgi:hypothetical protein
MEKLAEVLVAKAKSAQTNSDSESDSLSSSDSSFSSDGPTELIEAPSVSIDPKEQDRSPPKGAAEKYQDLRDLGFEVNEDLLDYYELLS